MALKKQCSALVLAGLMAATVSTAEAQRHTNRGEHVAGRFDYYQLVLSWSPTHCEDNSRGRNDTQCGLRRARPFAFVLHGLWPQYEIGYPEACRTKNKPFVPNKAINAMMDIMPSRGLIIHQYRKHGTCSGYDAVNYFKASRILFNKVKIPKRYNKPTKAFLLRPEDLVRDFQEVNPAIGAGMMQVICKRGNKNQLREIRVCFDKKGKFRRCSGRSTRHQCARKNMYVPPVRVSR